MNRLTRQWLSLAALTAVLMGGCARQGNPGQQPQQQAGLISSTTGDLDACAVALGNLPPGDNGPGTAAARVDPGAPGMLGAQSAPGAAPRAPAGDENGRMVQPGAGRGTAATDEANRALDTDGNTPVTTANGLLLGNVALVGLPEVNGTPTTAGGPAAPGAPGAAGGPTAAGANAAAANAHGNNTGANMDAVSRIHTACPSVVQIRQVQASDLVHLARIAGHVRDGRPMTDYMTDLTKINSRARTVFTAQQRGAAAPPAAQPGARANVTPPRVPSPGSTGSPDLVDPAPAAPLIPGNHVPPAAPPAR